MTAVSNHLNSSLIIKTKREIITNILHNMRETHNIEYTSTTTDFTVTKLHHHLSHRYNDCNQRIVYHPQHKPLP